MSPRSTLALALLSAGLSACATLTPAPLPKPPKHQTLIPAQWTAPVAHEGSLVDLRQWWGQTGDALLPVLIDRAQAASPNLSSAAARLEQARAERVISGAALGPSIDAGASVSRGNNQFPLPLSRLANASLTASWEIDLFDARKLALQAAQARLEGAQAQWHDARVVVAAETALQYLSFRHCERVRALLDEDHQALLQLASLARLGASAGLQAPAQAQLAQAQASAGAARERQQHAACESDIKVLVALTGLSEEALRAHLASAATLPLPTPPTVAVARLPATVILQRPDIIRAERELLAALNELGQAQAARTPRLSLSGSIGIFSVRSRDLSSDIDTWSLGPVRMQLPVFDGGVLGAREAASQARYEDAVRQLEAAIRQAVKDVEQALTQADSVRLRLEHTQRSLAHLEQRHQSVLHRYRAGLATRQDLEESSRGLIGLRITLLGLTREQWIAGISLYRAAGGGWKDSSSS